MGNKVEYKRVEPPQWTAIPAGKTRIAMAGLIPSATTGAARQLAGQIAETHPDKYETWFYFSQRNPSTDFDQFTVDKFKDVKFPDHLKGMLLLMGYC